jgi:hypothetical protein
MSHLRYETTDSVVTAAHAAMQKFDESVSQQSKQSDQNEASIPVLMPSVLPTSSRKSDAIVAVRLQLVFPNGNAAAKFVTLTFYKCTGACGAVSKLSRTHSA